MAKTATLNYSFSGKIDSARIATIANATGQFRVNSAPVGGTATATLMSVRNITGNQGHAYTSVVYNTQTLTLPSMANVESISWSCGSYGYDISFVDATGATVSVKKSSAKTGTLTAAQMAKVVALGTGGSLKISMGMRDYLEGPAISEFSTSTSGWYPQSQQGAWQVNYSFSDTVSMTKYKTHTNVPISTTFTLTITYKDDPTSEQIVHYGTANGWIDCVAFYGDNGAWQPVEVRYGDSGAWRDIEKRTN